jgi:hypothetical protein
MTTLTGPDAITFAQSNGITTVDVWTHAIGLAPTRRPVKIADLGSTAARAITINTTELRDDCRSVLGRLRHSQPFATVPARAREYLEHHRLIDERTAGQVEATPRAAGYVADPSTFDV